MEQKNKVVIITGASSGIGEKLKEFYQKDGHTVVNFSRSATCDKFNYAVDVSNKQQVEDCVKQVYDTFGKIDVLINCAGYGVFGAVELTDENSAKRIMDVNYFGTLWCMQACLKYMQKGAKIVNISSACALYCLPFRSMYSASKSAVNMLSFGARMELKSFGIDVVSICPGDIKTNFSKNREVCLNTNEKYKQRLNNSFAYIAKTENKRMNKEKAVKKIYKICNKKRTKPMYIIGGKYKLLNFATKFCSTRTLLHLTNKFF